MDGAGTSSTSHDFTSQAHPWLAAIHLERTAYDFRCVAVARRGRGDGSAQVQGTRTLKNFVEALASYVIQ